VVGGFGEKTESGVVVWETLPTTCGDRCGIKAGSRLGTWAARIGAGPRIDILGVSRAAAATTATTATAGAYLGIRTGNCAVYIRGATTTAAAAVYAQMVHGATDSAQTDQYKRMGVGGDDDGDEDEDEYEAEDRDEEGDVDGEEQEQVR
jgi:hypothetical protein